MNHLVTTKRKPENSNKVPRGCTSVHRVCRRVLFDTIGEVGIHLSQGKRSSK